MTGTVQIAVEPCQSQDEAVSILWLHSSQSGTLEGHESVPGCATQTTRVNVRSQKSYRPPRRQASGKPHEILGRFSDGWPGRR